MAPRTPSSSPRRRTSRKANAARSHAERSSQTRAAVIDAAIRCLAESGYKHTTVTRIAELSGISWGGIQHQFGTKASIIQAVLEHTLDEFLLGIQEISAPDDSLETRARVLVDGAWNLVNRPAFTAFLEIVLSHRHVPRRENPAAAYIARVWRVMVAVWDHLFEDLGLDDERTRTARSVTFSTLSGMAIESIVRTDSPDFRRPLQILQETLVRILREPAAARE
jgi:AcrR family transcriptional regulator